SCVFYLNRRAGAITKKFFWRNFLPSHSSLLLHFSRDHAVADFPAEILRSCDITGTAQRNRRASALSTARLGLSVPSVPGDGRGSWSGSGTPPDRSGRRGSGPARLSPLG